MSLVLFNQNTISSIKMLMLYFIKHHTKPETALTHTDKKDGERSSHILCYLITCPNSQLKEQVVLSTQMCYNTAFSTKTDNCGVGK